MPNWRPSFLEASTPKSFKDDVVWASHHTPTGIRIDRLLLHPEFRDLMVSCHNVRDGSRELINGLLAPHIVASCKCKRRSKPRLLDSQPKSWSNVSSGSHEERAAESETQSSGNFPDALSLMLNVERLIILKLQAFDHG